MLPVSSYNNIVSDNIIVKVLSVADLPVRGGRCRRDDILLTAAGTGGRRLIGCRRVCCRRIFMRQQIVVSRLIYKKIVFIARTGLT